MVSVRYRGSIAKNVPYDVRTHLVENWSTSPQVIIERNVKEPKSEKRKAIDQKQCADDNEIEIKVEVTDLKEEKRQEITPKLSTDLKKESSEGKEDKPCSEEGKVKRKQSAGVNETSVKKGKKKTRDDSKPPISLPRAPRGQRRGGGNNIGYHVLPNYGRIFSPEEKRKMKSLADKNRGLLALRQGDMMAAMKYLEGHSMPELEELMRNTTCQTDVKETVERTVGEVQIVYEDKNVDHGVTSNDITKEKEVLSLVTKDNDNQTCTNEDHDQQSTDVVDNIGSLPLERKVERKTVDTSLTSKDVLSLVRKDNDNQTHTNEDHDHQSTDSVDRIGSLPDRNGDTIEQSSQNETVDTAVTSEEVPHDTQSRTNEDHSQESTDSVDKIGNLRDRNGDTIEQSSQHETVDTSVTSEEVPHDTQSGTNEDHAQESTDIVDKIGTFLRTEKAVLKMRLWKLLSHPRRFHMTLKVV